jgi:hypothetical protein
MARIAGIKIEKNINGAPISVCIDLRKHPDIWDLLIEKGILARNEFSPYDKKFVEMIKKSEQEPTKSVNLEKYGIKI